MAATLVGGAQQCCGADQRTYGRAHAFANSHGRMPRLDLVIVNGRKTVVFKHRLPSEPIVVIPIGRGSRVP